jgi:adenine-specific DNA-methyltransferase
MVYAANLRDGRVHWPSSESRKPQALVCSPETTNLRVPSERYVLVKRFSAKEERRRVVAAVYEPDDLPTGDAGFDNKLNYFHAAGAGLERDVARGLCLWLNSTVLDQHFRTFSGHTQVNAGDLRSLRYPSPAILSALGAAWGSSSLPDQSKIDALIDERVFGITS